MSSSFSRTLQSLRIDSQRGSAACIAFAVVVLMGWAGWFLFARVTVYELSSTARLEVDRASHPIGAPVDGLVVACPMRLDQEVEAGQVVVEIDSSVQQRELQEQRAALDAASAQLKALSEETVNMGRARSGRVATGSAARSEARAKLQEAEAAAKSAQELASRSEHLKAEGLASDLDLIRAQSDAQQRRHAAVAAQAELDRLEWDTVTQTSDRQAGLDSLRRLRASLEGHLASATASMARLEVEIARRRVRAPIAGRVGAISPIRAGTVLTAGDRIAVIVPKRELQVVAHFAPTALGRVRNGQPARLRLAAFPWTQYGSVPSRVEQVGSELWDGYVRVELSVSPNPQSAIPFQHGEPGTVEVEIERATPFHLLLRAAGKLLRPGEIKTVPVPREKAPG